MRTVTGTDGTLTTTCYDDTRSERNLEMMRNTKINAQT